MNLDSYIRKIEDFPKKGILYRDLTTLFQNEKAFAYAIDTLNEMLATYKFEKIVAIEARGFVVGSALAYKKQCPLILARKKAKLPYKKISAEYDLEYGKDQLEMHTDALEKNDRVAIVDDVLATGGTALAAAKLVKTLNASTVAFGFLINLQALGGENKIKPAPVHYLLQY